MPASYIAVDNSVNIDFQPDISADVYHKLHKDERLSDSDDKRRHHDPEIAFHELC